MDRSHDSPRASKNGSSSEAAGSAPLDWRGYEFFSVDSPQTVRFEDAIHVSTRNQSGRPETWHLDLKVVHPLPLDEKSSLNQGEPTLCLGFEEQLKGATKIRPSLSLVVATNSCRLVDSELASIPLTDVSSRDGAQQHHFRPQTCPADVVEKLTLLRAAALRVSFFKERELKPEHAVNLIMSYAQQRALEFARHLPQAPTLVVLRSAGSRVLNQREARELGFSLKLPRVEVMAGGRVPTVLRESDPVEVHDSLRMKQSSLSGLINSVQISCALLGIEPIPAELIDGSVPPTSQQDKLKHMTKVPPALRAVIEDRQRIIRELLKNSAPTAAE